MHIYLRSIQCILIKMYILFCASISFNSVLYIFYVNKYNFVFSIRPLFMFQNTAKYKDKKAYNLTTHADIFRCHIKIANSNWLLTICQGLFYLLVSLIQKLWGLGTIINPVLQISFQVPSHRDNKSWSPGEDPGSLGAEPISEPSEYCVENKHKNAFMSFLASIHLPSIHLCLYKTDHTCF